MVCIENGAQIGARWSAIQYAFSDGKYRVAMHALKPLETNIALFSSLSATDLIH